MGRDGIKFVGGQSNVMTTAVASVGQDVPNSDRTQTSTTLSQCAGLPIQTTIHE